MGRRSVRDLLRLERTGTAAPVGTAVGADKADAPPPSIGIGTDDDTGVTPAKPPKTPKK
jgi:hypothetical protein